MKRYRLNGRPLGMSFAEIDGRGVGEEWEADMDEDVERLLVGAGALAVASEKQSEPVQPQEQTPPEEPQAEEPQAEEPVSNVEPPAASVTTHEKAAVHVKGQTRGPGQQTPRNRP